MPAPPSRAHLDALAPPPRSCSVAPVLEKNLEFLNDCLDDLMGEQGKLTAYQTALRRQQQAVAQFKLQRRQENQAKRAAGEEVLPDEPPEGMFKPVAEPNQLDNMLLSNQVGCGGRVGERVASGWVGGSPAPCTHHSHPPVHR